MTLTLYEHPFASYCWKALIALDELGLAFEPRLVESDDDRARLAVLWPMASMPVLVDETSGMVVQQSTAIVEYLDGLSAQPVLVPAQPAEALQARLWDRICDAYVMTPMQKIVGDSLRPEGRRDAYGVEQAHADLERAYAMLDARLAERAWLACGSFTLAECAAAPALYYARVVHRFDEERAPELTRYFRALIARPSVARVIDGARPYRAVFPLPWPDDAT